LGVIVLWGGAISRRSKMMERAQSVTGVRSIRTPSGLIARPWDLCHHPRDVFWRGKRAMKVLVCFFAFFFSLNSLSAQVSDFANERVPLTPLNGMWRFHAGDDTRWAAAAFDDSDWSLLRPDRGWEEQGYKGHQRQCDDGNQNASPRLT
jgi:hypothetical protein